MLDTTMYPVFRKGKRIVSGPTAVLSSRGPGCIENTLRMSEAHEVNSCVSTPACSVTASKYSSEC